MHVGVVWTVRQVSTERELGKQGSPKFHQSKLAKFQVFLSASFLSDVLTEPESNRLCWGFPHCCIFKEVYGSAEPQMTAAREALQIRHIDKYTNDCCEISITNDPQWIVLSLGIIPCHLCVFDTFWPEGFKDCLGLYSHCHNFLFKRVYKLFCSCEGHYLLWKIQEEYVRGLCFDLVLVSCCWCSFQWCQTFSLFLEWCTIAALSCNGQQIYSCKLFPNPTGSHNSQGLRLLSIRPPLRAWAFAGKVWYNIAATFRCIVLKTYRVGAK